MATSSQQNGPIYWAFQELPLDAATQHFMVTGSTGSGKTTVIRLLMKSILPTIKKEGRTKRALVYDGKREYVSFIYDLEPHADVIIFNPFDVRSFAWDISSDVTTARHANAIASILIPEEPNSQQRFFPDAAKSLLATIMIALARRKQDDGKPWTLRDVILALRSAKRMRALVEPFDLIKDMAAPYLNDEKVMPAIISTLATKLNPFEVVAALWERAIAKGRTMSLKNWLTTESILVLGSSPSNRASLDPINQVIFKRLSDLILDSKDTRSNLTWLFMDEVREAGKLEGLSSLLNQGRSKGLAVVLGFQEIEGMENIYNEKVAGEIFGQCAHKTFLRTNSQKTAQWIQSHCGELQQIEPQYSISDTSGPQGSRTTSVTYQRKVEHSVLASEVMTYPMTGPKEGLTALQDVPGLNLETTVCPWAKLEELLEMKKPKKSDSNPELSNECPWPEGKLEDELLSLWSKEENERFGLSSGADGKAEETAKTKSHESTISALRNSPERKPH